MAIDTREKRAAVSGLYPWTGTGLTPDAAQDQEWRQEAGYGYPGILAVTGASVLEVFDFSSEPLETFDLVSEPLEAFDFTSEPLETFDFVSE